MKRYAKETPAKFISRNKSFLIRKWKEGISYEQLSQIVRSYFPENKISKQLIFYHLKTSLTDEDRLMRFTHNLTKKK